MSTARRPVRSSPPPSNFRYSVFSEGNDFGICETADCDRPARAHCETCNGEHCRWHIDHDKHGAR